MVVCIWVATGVSVGRLPYFHVNGSATYALKY